MAKMTGRLFSNCLVLCLFLSWANKPGCAQSHGWKVESREHSQTATSRAVTQLAHQQMDSAIASALEATSADSADPIAFHILGLALDMKGRYQEALDALHKAWQLNSGDGETALSIGYTHYLMHNYEKAIAAWHKALDLNPNLCHINGDLGFAYIRLADFARADESFRRLIGCQPNSQLGYHGLALVHYLTGDLSGARKSAEHAESISAYPPVTLLLAQLDVLAGDRSRAGKRYIEYNTATRKPGWHRSMTALGYPIQHDFKWDPLLADNFDNAFLMQARSLVGSREASKQRSLSRQGKAEAHLAKAREALKQSPEDYTLAREVANLELAAAEYSDATEHYKQSMHGCPDCLVDCLNLGLAAEADGKPAEASASVRRYQERFPSERLSPALTSIARVDPALSGPSTRKPVEYSTTSHTEIIEKHSSSQIGSGQDGGF